MRARAKNGGVEQEMGMETMRDPECLMGDLGRTLEKISLVNNKPLPSILSVVWDSCMD